MASTQGYVHRADYVTERLAGKPAEFAGDPAYQDQERTFAIVYYETADGAYAARASTSSRSGWADSDVELADRIPYILDLSQGPRGRGHDRRPAQGQGRHQRRSSPATRSSRST